MPPAICASGQEPDIGASLAPQWQAQVIASLSNAIVVPKCLASPEGHQTLFLLNSWTENAFATLQIQPGPPCLKSFEASVKRIPTVGESV